MQKTRERFGWERRRVLINHEAVIFGCPLFVLEGCGTLLHGRDMPAVLFIPGVVVVVM